MTDERTLIGSEDSRRSFMKKGALASGALALGGSAIGSAGAQEDDTGVGGDDTGTGGDGDTVLMLHPDAVEDAEFTVASEEVSWSPIDDGGIGGTETEEDDGLGGNETEEDDDGLSGNETDDEIGAETPTPDEGGSGDFTTYMIQYGFSASHVAPVFVEGDVDLSEGDEQQFGEIEEIVEQPGGGGTNETGDDGGTEDEPLYVRVALEDADGAGGTPDEETPTETETEEPDDGTTPDDDGIGGDDEESPTTPTEEDGDGIGGDDDDGGFFDF